MCYCTSENTHKATYRCCVRLNEQDRFPQLAPYRRWWTMGMAGFTACDKCISKEAKTAMTHVHQMAGKKA